VLNTPECQVSGRFAPRLFPAKTASPVRVLTYVDYGIALIMRRANDAPQRGVTVVSTLQFTWGVSVSDSLSGSFGRLNSLSLCSCFKRDFWFTENSGHSRWILSPGALLVYKARKLTTEPRSANSRKAAHKRRTLCSTRPMKSIKLKMFTSCC